MLRSIASFFLNSFFFVDRFLRNFLFIFKFRKKFKNKSLFLSWHWAFGHQALSLDSIAKYYNDLKTIIVFQTINTKRNNKYLPELFNGFYNVLYTYESNNIRKCHMNHLSLEIIFKFFLKSEVKQILNYKDFVRFIEKKFPIKKNKLKIFDENKKTISDHSDAPLWVDEISKIKEINYKLNQENFDKCKIFLNSVGINFKNKKNISFFFRSIQTKNSYYDFLRNSYNFENYISTLNYFANNNFNVFITCDDDINTKEIEKIDNVTVLSKYKSIFDVSLLNMFVYQISDKIVGQSSGSIILASLMKKKVFVVDYSPPFIGFPEKTNILLPKFKINGKDLYFNDYKNLDFIYGKGFNLDNQVISNSSSAIYNFIVNSENQKTINDLLPLDLAISHRRNKVYCISDFEKN